MNQADAALLQPGSQGLIAQGAGRPGRARQTVTIPVLSLRSGDSPRLEGEDRAHVARLAEAESPLPPILVERSSMRVIDGMHRLLAASLNGQETIEVEFFDGNSADAFLRAVQANVTHGLPLTLADRRAAAARILASHPHLSDRMIGQISGLGARTVAAIRRRSPDAATQVTTRVGKDGRVRPLSSVEGRKRAAAVLAERPDASLRQVAKHAGVSPATVRDVRRRLARGEGPVPAGAAVACADAGAAKLGHTERPGADEMLPSPEVMLRKLLRDPALRHNEQGRYLLRLLQLTEAGAQDWPSVTAAVPPYSAASVARLARHYAQSWLDLAEELEDRARVIDPRARLRASRRS